MTFGSSAAWVISQGLGGRKGKLMRAGEAARRLAWCQTVSQHPSGLFSAASAAKAPVCCGSLEVLCDVSTKTWMEKYCGEQLIAQECQQLFQFMEQWAGLPVSPPRIDVVLHQGPSFKSTCGHSKSANLEKKIKKIAVTFSNTELQYLV